VPPEIIFDQGLGDLFVIRVAGNIVDDAILGSIEYAVEHLDVALVMVLGHERCGAVEAALQEGEIAGHIGALVKAIAPAVPPASDRSGDRLDRAVRANVVRVVAQLRASHPVLAERVSGGRLRVAGARYDLDSGTVELLR
jgi:carbonic anhydrase